MDTIPISKFKATVLSALERVRRTGRPLRITRFGKPLADVVPAAPEKPQRDWLGSLRGTLEIRGDIVGPSSDLAHGSARGTRSHGRARSGVDRVGRGPSRQP